MRKIFLLVFILSELIFTQELVSDRPDQTESAVTLPKNYFQFEHGSVHENFNGNSNKFTASSNLFRYGILENLEIRFASEFTNGNLNIPIEIGAKYQFKNDEMNVAFLGHLIKDGEIVSLNNLFLISFPLTEKIDFSTNLGVEINNENQTNLNYTFSVGIPLAEKINYFLEVYGNKEKLKNNLFADNGITYSVKQNLQLDFAFGIGLNEKYNFLTLGICYRMPN